MSKKQPHQAFFEIVEQLTAAGEPFEIREREIDGRCYRYYPNAPQDLARLLTAGRVHGDKEFLLYEGECWSFDDFFARADAAASQLQERWNLEPGQRVAIAMRNYPEWMAAFTAIAFTGAVPAPANSWGSADELGYVLQDSGARVVFCDQARFELLRPQLEKSGVPAIVARPDSELPPGALSWEEFIAPGMGKSARTPELREDLPALLMYTSGTTGRPKGVLSLQRQICQAIYNFECVGLAMGICNGDILAQVMKDGDIYSALLAVPLFHISGCHAGFLLNVRSGRRMVMMYKWDVERTLEYIEQEKIGILSLAPAMLMQLLTHPDFERTDTSSLFSIGGGGSAFPAGLAEQIEKQAPQRMPGCGYGSTETNSSAHSMNGHMFRARPSSAGLPAGIMEVKICDEHGGELPVGEAGEIRVYGLPVAEGYWGLEQETRETFIDGWFRTGDIGYLDEDGYLYVVDRIKDMVIRAGENISSQEVEDALGRHPDIVEAAVLGLPHPVLGEEVAAVAVLRDGRSPEEREVKDFVRTQVAHFKTPEHLILRAEPLPRNATGKVLKKELRELEAWKEMRNG